MLLKRVIVGAILIPLVLLVIIAGGWIFAGGVTLVLGLAAWEYFLMVERGGFKPSAFLLIGGVVLLSLLRFQYGFYGSELAFGLLVLLGMFLAVRSLELGNDQPASQFAMNLIGLVYLGWIGPYFISLGTLPDGKLWLMLALPAAWFADMGAYFIGVPFGRHKFCPRVSPHKTWEGYIGGLPFAVLGTLAMAAVFQGYAPTITPQKGAIIGLIIGILAPLGDLSESMLKRQFGIKDSSNLLPGHGGVMDRIDSSLWATILGYYLISIFML